MPSLETIMLFMATALVLNLTPGPSILFILSRCLAEGRPAAIYWFLGLRRLPSFMPWPRPSGCPRCLPTGAQAPVGLGIRMAFSDRR